MTQDLRVFESTLEKGKPADIRVTSGGEDGPASVIKGMNEGLQSMQPGGVRRANEQGETGALCFASAPWRCVGAVACRRVAAASQQLCSLWTEAGSSLANGSPAALIAQR